jgi:hypothetical protein
MLGYGFVLDNVLRPIELSLRVFNLVLRLHVISHRMHPFNLQGDDNNGLVRSKVLRRYASCGLLFSRVPINRHSAGPRIKHEGGAKKKRRGQSCPRFYAVWRTANSARRRVGLGAASRAIGISFDGPAVAARLLVHFLGAAGRTGGRVRRVRGRIVHRSTGISFNGPIGAVGPLVHSLGRCLLCACNGNAGDQSRRRYETRAHLHGLFLCSRDAAQLRGRRSRVWLVAFGKREKAKWPMPKVRQGAMPGGLWDELPECSGSVHA